MQQLEKLQTVLFEILGDLKSKHLFDNIYEFEHEHFRVFARRYNELWLISVDLKSAFDKIQRSPIHFIIEDNRNFSKRKKDRIHQAINALIKSKKRNDIEFFSREAFDDLSYYSIISKMRD
jgi:rubrerythrin